MMLFPRYIAEDVKTLDVSSTAFNDHEYIPSKYTCDGDNVNPPLSIKKIPLETKYLAIIVEDPDAPVRPWAHWIVWNMPPTVLIKEKLYPVLGTSGFNDFGKRNYMGPCPPSGIHHYHFKVYALDDFINLKSGSTKIELEKAISSHIIGFGELVGLYKKIK